MWSHRSVEPLLFTVVRIKMLQFLKSSQLLRSPFASVSFTRLSLRHLSTVTSPQQPTEDPESLTLPPKTRTKTPLETQFESWIQNLKPGFTQSDVVKALRAQTDPDLALDIFHWTGQQKNYKHNDLTYYTVIKSLINGKRYNTAETLIEEVIAGACNPSVELYNSIIKFLCSRRLLYNRAFDVYKLMLKSDDFKPTLETYTLLLNSLLRRFTKLSVCYVYLHTVKSLSKQMKSVGVIPDTFVLNMVIKAYSKCLEVDEAIRVFRKMGLYGCEPNAFSYSYIIQGLCEKERVGNALEFYREMKRRELVASASMYMILSCSLGMAQRFDEAIEVVFDMLGKGKGPDMLTYRTVLEGLCREGRSDDAFELLEKWRKMDVTMGEKNYKILLNGLHYVIRE